MEEGHFSISNSFNTCMLWESVCLRVFRQSMLGELAIMFFVPGKINLFWPKLLDGESPAHDAR